MIQKGVKRPRPSSPMTPKTPDISIKHSHSTPASGKKPTFFFKTESKGKRLLPKTPLKKTGIKRSPSYFNTPEKSSEESATELLFSEEVGESPWNTGAELARDTIRKLRRQTRKTLVKKGAKQVKKGILKQNLHLAGNHLRRL